MRVLGLEAKAMDNKTNKACELCGKPLKRGDRFCSHKCADKAHAVEMLGPKHPRWNGSSSILDRERRPICQECGRSIIWLDTWKLSHNGGRFCSNKCKRCWHKGHPANGGGIERECLVCGKKFRASQKIVKKGFGLFCCRACYHRHVGPSSVEHRLAHELDRMGISYLTTQFILGSEVDILVGNVPIFCDGDYWHNLPGRPEHDLKVWDKLTRAGYIPLRFWESDISEDVVECVREILTAVAESRYSSLPADDRMEG